MSEISREEAIKNLSLVRASLDYIEIDEELDQAISDMEKLEKIEKIVDEMWDEDSYYNNTVRFAEKIEQIVKEVGEKR